MTQVKQMDPPTDDVAPVIDPEVLREATERYLANPLFRAAQYDELVLDDNPFRRPVRPDDIGLVDFSDRLGRDNFSQLSGLMGQRMLLNIHDTRKLMLPANPTADKWRDYADFYSEGNRLLGDVIRPHLEQHLFAFVVDEAAPVTTTDAAQLLSRVREVAAVRRDQATRLRELIAGSTSSEAMVSMVAIQSQAIALNARLAPRPASSEDGALSGITGHSVGRLSDVAHAVATRTGLKFEAHSYFQYYLPATLALMNYLNAATQDPGRAFRLIGALAAQWLDVEAMAGLYHGLLPAEPAKTLIRLDERGDALTAVSTVISAAERTGGPFAVSQVSRGFEEYAVLLDVQHTDFSRQFTWIDAMPEYREKARRLQGAIEKYQIPVDMDTFVESWEECSTTHVHDEDRLLVIESGEMDFWNCFGVQHTYRPGDMAFIPRWRLHGSVVLTGQCVYHQPVITAELDALYG